MYIKNSDMLKKWKKIDVLVDGVDSLVDKGYLYKFSQESNEAFKIRKNNSSLFNMFNRTISGLSGIAFYKDILLGEDNSNEIKKHIEDIDLLGTHLNLFSQEVLESALTYGHSFIFIGYPETNAKTVRDMKDMGIRPYWRHIKPHNVVNWRQEFINGTPKLTLVVVQDTQVIYDGLDESSEIIYRVYRPNRWEILKEDGKTIISQGDTSFDFIPIVPVYSNKTGFFESKPLFYDLAVNNIKHFNMSSDLSNIIHKTCVPLLVWKTTSEEKESITISPNAVTIIDPDDELDYIEPSGTSIMAVQTEITNIEKRIGQDGIAMLMGKKQQIQTAHESQLDFVMSNSGLTKTLQSLKDGLEQALLFHSKMIGDDKSGSVTVSIDYRMGDVDANLLNAMHSALESGNLSVEQWLDFLNKNNLTSEDFDIEKEKSFIEKNKQDKKEV